MKLAPSAYGELLQCYQEVFRQPTQLPPSRNRDHAIVLQPGAVPMNVRPYRYPHFPKE